MFCLLMSIDVIYHGSFSLCRYAIGGYDGANELSSVEVLDPRVGFWMKGEPMKETRKYAGAVAIGDSIYVMGGVNEELKLLHTVCIMHPSP